MTDYTKLYDGISKVAWGYLFLYFDINLGTVSILPEFVGYLLFLSAINLLQDEERDLKLLRTLGILMAVWHGADWLASWVAIDLDGKSQFIDIATSLINMYFHFQLLTNLASIAAKYQPDGENFDTRLLKYRTLQTVMLTVIMILTSLSSVFTEAWAYISIVIAIAYIIVGICLMRALFKLRRCLPTENITEQTENETE